MLEVIAIVAGVIAVVVGVLLGLAAMQPSVFRVQRSALMNAPADKVYGYLHNMHKFNSWNPFVKMDPESKLQYSGPSEGPGAAYTWESKKMGAGRLEITEVASPSKVQMKLDFFRPFPGSNVALFTVDGRGTASNVTWSLEGPVAFVPKIMSLFFSMDAMMGKSFEDGLADLKAKVEA